MQQDLFQNELEKKYVQAYREGNSQPTNPENSFDEDTTVPVQSATPITPTPAQQLAEEAAPEYVPPMMFGALITDYIKAYLPNGVPEGSRHKFAIKLASDLLVLLDGDTEKTKALLLSQQWVKDVVAERGMKEIDDILLAAQKLKQKRESENLTELQPSKNMQRAIEQVTGRKYRELVAEANKAIMGTGFDSEQQNILKTLDRIGRELEKLKRYFPLLSLLCFRMKPKYYPAAFFVGGAFAMTLMTRCWYRFWPKPGEKCRMNSLLMLIGRMGGMKSIAVILYRIMMEPVRMSDAPQIAALNKFNTEREQNNQGKANTSPRPKGIYRALPSETSTAALREAEANAHEQIDGEDYCLHVSIFDSELQNTLSQLKRGYMEAQVTYWLKSFHNEPHGAYLKTASAPIGETPIHFNGVYTGTADALRKINVESNIVNGLMSRFTIVPNADSNFEMLEVHEYDEEAKRRDEELKDWAYKLDSCMGEIPCKSISEALKQWTERRMADAGEDNDMAEEDLIKRPCWHAINYALPFIVSRHWKQMVDDNGHWKCGADFKPDKTDIRLVILIANAQLAFQRYFCKHTLEKYYENLAQDAITKTPRRKKTQVSFSKLPDIFTSDDVMLAYGYDSTGSVCSRLKRLQDDGMAQRITKGENKGKYRKLT